MFAGSRRLRPAEPVAPLADALADALSHVGDPRAAGEVLRIGGLHSKAPELALRRGERAFAAGDAAAALEAMVPAWEAGWDDPRLNARLALASLILGLYDVAGTLTDDADSLDARLVRWILDTWEGDPAESVAFERAEVAWAMRALIQQLVRCGRDDLAARAWLAAVEVCPDAADRLGAAPAPPPEPNPYAPPLDGRTRFRDAWTGAAPDAVFSWGWSAGRNILRGERAALLCPTPGPLLPLFGHARLTAVASQRVSGAQLVAEPESLPLAGARQLHVCAAFWLEQAMNPLGAMQAITRALTHEGQLHLICAGPEAPASDAPLRLSPQLVERLCEKAGLSVTGVAARDARGGPTRPESATVLLLQAERRVI